MMSTHSQRRRRAAPIALICAALATSASCRRESVKPAPARGGKPQVYVVNQVLETFARRLGGEAVEVRFPAPIGADPAQWSPDEASLGGYQRADLVLLNGAGYAQWTQHYSLPTGSQVDTTEAVAARLLDDEEQVTHQHGAGGRHTHGTMAVTTWLDLTLAIEQARSVSEALQRVAPEAEREIAERFARLREELERSDARLLTWGGSLESRPILSSHPLYQYLAARYRLNLKSVHWEPEVPPTPEQWEALDQLLKEHSGRLMLWEGAPLEATRRQLSERGIATVVFEPGAASREDGADFLDVLERNLRRLESVKVE